jgi:uncharacterized membrane protein
MEEYDIQTLFLITLAWALGWIAGCSWYDLTNENAKTQHKVSVIVCSILCALIVAFLFRYSEC